MTTRANQQQLPASAATIMAMRDALDRAYPLVLDAIPFGDNEEDIEMRTLANDIRTLLNGTREVCGIPIIHRQKVIP